MKYCHMIRIPFQISLMTYLSRLLHLFLIPIFRFVGRQETDAISGLCDLVPEFQKAFERHKVGHHILIARSDALPTVDTFELVASTVEFYDGLGYEYVITSAVNQWTGAAFEALGGTRVHFAPFRAEKLLDASNVPLPDKPTSSDGFLSAKDSGSMIYVIRLK